jgi:hypothetical protein
MTGILAGDAVESACACVGPSCKPGYNILTFNNVVNFKFQEGCYPSADSGFITCTKKVGYTRLVHQLESIFPRVDVLIWGDVIADGIDMPFDLGLL